ncbi:MAG: hypothetical protein V1743_01930 [Nanoarchaeota archaeon]
MTIEQSNNARKTIEILIGDSFIQDSYPAAKAKYASIMNDLQNECGCDIHVTYTNWYRQFIRTMREKEYSIVASDIYYACYGSWSSHDASEEIMAAVDELQKRPHVIFLHQVGMSITPETRKADANVDITDGYDLLKECLMTWIRKKTG